MQIENIETHGHEVLEMMIESGHPYSNESLKTAIDLKFGTDARFYICSGGNMTANELIEALWAKDKFTGTTESFVFDPANRCNH
ncbi:MAG: YecH family metal-binding protein [Opitutaceae bacterium]